MISLARGTAVLAVSLLSLGSWQSAAGGECAPETDARAFTKCLICHTAARDAGHMSGPNLWGIFGKAAGTVVGYTYSDAISKSAIDWDAANLRSYLADPSGFLPGTRMAMAPIRDAAELDAIICHLATLKD